MALTLSAVTNNPIARLAQVNAGAGGISLHGYQRACLEVIGKDTEIVNKWLPFVPKKLWFQFNPASVTISKKVSWEASGGESGGTDAHFEKGADGKVFYRPAQSGSQPNRNAPKLEFKGGEAATYSLELLFDTTDQTPGSPGRDVRRYTYDLLALLVGKDKDANEIYDPPAVRFVWGQFTLFEAVIESAEISYVMFDPDGTPVRATANVGFIEWVVKAGTGPQNPTTRTEPRKTWIVQQGQTLHQIAHAEYGHPSHWRHLADSNNLLNPLKLQPGQVLILPPLP